jgi:hypothetical protein
MTIMPGIELPDTAIADICRIHQVKELSLFGSAARGVLADARPIYAAEEQAKAPIPH